MNLKKINLYDAIKDNYLSIRQAAYFTGLSKSTINRHLRQGKYENSLMIDGFWLVYVYDLNKIKNNEKLNGDK